MKLKQKKAPVVRKVTKAVAKRSVTTKATSPRLSLIKARVVAVRPARKPALPGKGAVLVALKKKERAAEVAKLEFKKSPEALIAPAANSTDAATLAMPAGNIVPLPENFDPENEEPTQEALQKEQEVEVKPVSMEEIRQAYDGDTAYQLYLKEIGQTALLTIEEENALAARIKKGDKAARERMIKANLRLVVKIARRCNGMPVLMSDNSKGPYRGSLYIVYADQTNGEGDTDIWFTKSHNYGDNWVLPMRINNDGKGKHQYLPWMTVDQETGYIYIVYYDRRDHDDNQTDVYLAYSTNGGSTFKNVKISEMPFVPQADRFFGDYNNISAHKGIIAPIWTRMDEGKTSVWTSIIKHEDLPK